MKSIFMKLTVLSLLSLCLVSCDDDDDTGGNTDHVTCVPQCRDANVLLTCDPDTGVVMEKNCLSGCADNACAEDKICKSKSIRCDAGNTCGTGICVPDSMINAKAGDDWHDDWVNHCRGTLAINAYTDIETGKTGVFVEDCADAGCSVVVEKDDTGEAVSYAWCNNPENDSKCKKDGDSVNYCGIIGKTDFQSSYLCRTNTAGELTATNRMDFGEYNVCGNGCENGACLDETPKKGMPCEYGKTPSYCVTHGSSTWKAECGSDNKIYVQECGVPSTCLTYQNSLGLTAAQCFEPGSRCRGDSTDLTQECDYDPSFLLKLSCVDTSDGQKHYIVTDTLKCGEAGCNSDTNQCNP